MVKLDGVCDPERCDLIGVRGEFVNYQILQGVFRLIVDDFDENMMILNCQKIYLCLWYKDFVELCVEVEQSSFDELCVNLVQFIERVMM